MSQAQVQLLSAPSSLSRPASRPTGILTISCPDRVGIVAAVSGFLADRGANIVDAQQHTDQAKQMFFMRVEFSPGNSRNGMHDFEPAFSPIADRFSMNWSLHMSDRIPVMGIMVSRFDHCLVDLLARHRIGELRVGIPVIVSNHPDLAPIAAAFNIPFEVVPVNSSTEPTAEARALDILQSAGCHFVVLARYMQILSSRFLDAFPYRVINIHHGFLPAFPGAHPYQQAYDRGVKMIGATSHYASEVLDDGPIIEQDVVSVGHRDTVQELTRKGRDVERVVLARAVSAHAEGRVLVHGRRTIVFD